MKDGNFDLIHALTKKAEVLAVYDRYARDSAGCPKCQDLWRQIRQDDARHHDMLLQEINRHAKDERFD